MMKTDWTITLVALMFSAMAWAQQTEDYGRYYKDLPVKMKQVKTVELPKRSVTLTDYGAVADGQTLNAEAFAKAIEDLAQKGGGRLIVPKGLWLTGPIQLKSNIELHLQRNAIIYLSDDKRLFVNPEDPKGRCLSGVSATNCENIAITGEGIIDGNGAEWRIAKRTKMSDMEWHALKRKGGRISDDGKLWRPWRMKNGLPDIDETPEKQEERRADLVRFYNCKNIMLKGVTIQNSPRFHVHPFYCKNIIIDGINVVCPWNAQNGDGIDLSDCQQVLIVNTTLDVGDDGFCLKSSKPKKNMDSGNEDILIQDNHVRHAHGGFVLGSNTAAGMRRLVCRHNTFTQTYAGLRFKSYIGSGGRTEQIYVDDIIMTDIQTNAIVFQCDYPKDGKDGDEKYNDPEYVSSFTEKERRYTPEFQDIHISNIVCKKARTAIRATGLIGLNCVHDITISDCLINYYETGNAIHQPTTDIKLERVKMVR
jgi:polygalacturonase